MKGQYILNMYKVLKIMIEHEKVPVQKFNISEIMILVCCKGDNLPQQTSLNMIWQNHIRIYVIGESTAYSGYK